MKGQDIRRQGYNKNFIAGLYINTDIIARV